MSVRDLTILGCSSQQSTRMRNHGGYLIRWNGEGFLFDPGEGTQRQCIFANIAPPTITRIFVSHFHGDHCLGLGSILVRLNLDNISHPIHCYYPASGKKYFDRLRYSTIYRERIEVIEHPVNTAGVVHEDEKFRIEAFFLQHGVNNIGWRIEEQPRRRFDRMALAKHRVQGRAVQELLLSGEISIDGKVVFLDDCSHLEKGDVVAVVIDTLPCIAAKRCAQRAKLLLCESTYLETDRQLAQKYKHMTAKQAAQIAKECQVEKLVITHFSARYKDLKPFSKEAKEVFPRTEVAEDCKVIPFPRK